MSPSLNEELEEEQSNVLLPEFVNFHQVVQVKVVQVIFVPSLYTDFLNTASTSSSDVLC